MWHVWGRIEMYAVFWWGNLMERHHLEDLDLDWRIKLRINLAQATDNWQGL